MFILKRHSWLGIESIKRGSFEECESWLIDTILVNNFAVKDVTFLDRSKGIEVTSKYGTKKIYYIIPKKD